MVISLKLGFFFFSILGKKKQDFGFWMNEWPTIFAGEKKNGTFAGGQFEYQKLNTTIRRRLVKVSVGQLDALDKCDPYYSGNRAEGTSIPFFGEM